MPRRLLLLLSLLALLFALPAAVRAAEEDEEAAAERWARERLLREARRAVGPNPDQSGDKAIAALKRSLLADIRFLMASDPKNDEERQQLREFEKTIAERILLVGRPASGEGENAVTETAGALQEARLLYGWLVGTQPCYVMVAPEGKPLEEGKPYPFPPKPEGPEPPLEPAGTESGAGLGPVPPGPLPLADGEAPAAPPPANGRPGGEPPKPDSGEPESGKPESGNPGPAEAPKPAVEPSEPTKELSPDDWAKDVVVPAEGGTLRRKVLGPLKCATASKLEEAAASPVVYVHKDVGRLKRHALVAEDIFAYNAPYAALRRRQADERNKAMQQDDPPASFVDEGMVRQKAVLLERYSKQVELRNRQRERVIQNLNEMVNDLDDWKTQAAILAQEIEEAKRALEAPAGATESPAAPGGPVPEDPEADADVPETNIRLRLAQARESCVSLDMTLTYLTAMRAEVRLDLLARLSRAAEEEATAAAEVHTRYETALLRLRNERRLDRLNSDERRLKKWIATLEGYEIEEGTIYAARLRAYRAALAMNQVVQEAVQTRRRVASRGVDEEAEAAARAERTRADASTSGGEASDVVKAPAGASETRLSPILLSPASRTWDVKYIEVATRELQNPALAGAFDAELVAQHYTAADERIRGLVASLKTAREDDRLRERFDAAQAEAQAALEPLKTDNFTMNARRLPLILDTTRDDFKAAMDGITEQREHNRQRLEALLAYRKLLVKQGGRSLLIRTDRDLDDTDVRAALDDTIGAVDAVTNWVTFRGEDHAGRWLPSNWLRLLAFLALLVGSFFVVVVGRRVVDRRIQRAVETHPLLAGTVASVKQERDEDRQRRVQEAEAAAELTAEEVLIQTAPDAAEQAPVAEPPPESPTEEDVLVGAVPLEEVSPEDVPERKPAAAEATPSEVVDSTAADERREVKR